MDGLSSRQQGNKRTLLDCNILLLKGFNDITLLKVFIKQTRATKCMNEVGYAFGK